MAVDRSYTRGDWTFRLQERDGRLFLSVPDCGSMADSVPREPAQLAWAEAAFAAIPGVVSVWPTVWEVAPAALPAIETALRSGRP